MKKAIEISVLRVTSNGKYIEFIISCPEDYYFTEFTVEVYGKPENKYSLAESLFMEDGEYKKDVHEYRGQFKLEDIDVFEPEMFKIELQAEHNENADSPLEDSMETCEGWEPDPQLNQTVYISDVSNVYSCLMNDILSLGKDLCDNAQVQDRIIRNYLILYAHREAMNLHYPTEAKKYFELLKKCFTKCGKKYESCSICGTNPEPSNCGCNK